MICGCGKMIGVYGLSILVGSFLAKLFNIQLLPEVLVLAPLGVKHTHLFFL